MSTMYKFPYDFNLLIMKKYGAKATLKLKVDGKETTEEGHIFSEATFISDLETPSE